MSITITTRLDRRIEANPRGLTIIETIRGNMIQAALTPDEARQIAAALTADQGGQWTRNDLPSEDDFQWEMFESRFGQFDGYRSPAKQHDLYTVFKSGIQYGQSRDLDHLNAHHPKPEQTMVPARPVSPEERGELWARIRDELRGVYSSTTDQDHRKLDLAASASADTAVEYLNDRGGLGIDAREPLERALRERDEALRKKGEAFDRAVRAERERDAAVARAEAAEREASEASKEYCDLYDQTVRDISRRRYEFEQASIEQIAAVLEESDRDHGGGATFKEMAGDVVASLGYRQTDAVSRADVEKALGRQLNGEVWDVTFPKVVDEMCDLFGVEAEQAVDPIEDAAVAAFKAAWHRADEEGDEGNRVRRGIRAARDVLGQEADQ